jgi:hypothetical protein
VGKEVGVARKRLMLNALDLSPGERVGEHDRAEELANRVLDQFGLEVDDDQFEVLCDAIEETALNKNGDVKDHRSLAAVCAHVAQAKIPDDVRTALLLVLLKDHFKRMRTRLAEVAAKTKAAETFD